jgi:tetratricopeptide (TPR) repeat protein
MTPQASFRLELWRSDESPWQGGASIAATLAGAHAKSQGELLAAFRQAVSLEPNDPDYYFILGQALAELGRHEDALPALREAVRMNSQDASYRYALAATCWALKRPDEAADSFREVVRLEPNGLRGMNGLGVALCASGRPREAVRVLHEALRADGDHAPIYRTLGVALWGCGRAAEALRAFQKAISLEPNAPGAHHDLGIALAAHGEPEQALASLDRARRLRPADPIVLLDRGDVLHHLGRETEALSAYEEAMRLEPGSLRSRPVSLENREAIRLRRLKDAVSAETAPMEGSLHPAGAASALASVLAGVVASLSGWRTVVTVVVLVSVAHATWTFGRPWLRYFLLKDRVADLASAAVEDGDLREPIGRAIRAQGLEAYLSEDDCAIESERPWRRIRCSYDHPVELLPGVTRTLRFRFEVERPLLRPEDPTFAR